MIGIYHILTIISATMVCSNEEISQRGMALLNHTYKSLYTEDYPSCLKTCTSDPECMSLNYWWNCSQCDLNSKTKYSAESKAFSRESPSTYMGLMREPGNLAKRQAYLLKCPWNSFQFDPSLNSSAAPCAVCYFFFEYLFGLINGACTFFF